MTRSMQELHQCGQSVWLDFITRQFMSEGKLAALIANDGISGVTSNPTIFQKAIQGGKEYDEAISRLIREGKTALRFSMLWPLKISSAPATCSGRCMTARRELMVLCPWRSILFWRATPSKPYPKLDGFSAPSAART